MADFRGKQPINTFQFILNTDGFNIFDSSGSVIRNLNVTTSYAVVQTSHEISSSFASSSMSSSVASTASYANTASYAPNYLNRAGDNTGGIIEFNTGGGLIFDNSSAGIVFQGVTLNDATLRIDSGFTTKLTTPSGSIYFSGSAVSASNFIGTASWASNATTANTSSYPWATSGTNIYNGNTTGNVGIGTTNPTSASLTVNGDVWSKNITASLLQGTASWANNATNLLGGVVSAANITSSGGLQIISGKVVIGTPNPPHANSSLEINNLTLVLQANSLNPGSADPGDGSGPALRLGYATSSVNDYGFVAAMNTGVGYKHLVLQPVGGTGYVGIAKVPTHPLDIAGNIFCSGITASLLQGTASWANNATTASYAITAVSSSYTTMGNSASGSYIIPIIQAGTELFGGNQTVNVSFNRTMPNTFYAVSMNQNTGPVTGVVYAALGKTLTGFTGSANTSNTISFDWVATSYV